MAVRNVGDYAELNAGFERLVTHVIERAGPEAITGLYGIPHDDPREIAPPHCRFDCAVSTSVSIDPDEQISVISHEGGPALQMIHYGDYDRIHVSADALYRTAVEENLQVSEQPLLIHYLQDPEEVAADLLVAHVYLGLYEPE